MYVCGITPYDATHMGHAATYVAFDLLNRAWRSAGHDVPYVQNVTDVDDPLLERATQHATGGARRTRDRAVPHRHGGTARAAPGRLRRRYRVDPARGRDGRAAAGSGRVYDVDGDLYFSVTPTPPSARSPAGPRARCWRSSASAGETPTAPARRTRSTACSGGRAPGRAGLGLTLGRAAPAGTSSAPRSRAHLGAAIDVQGGGSDLVFPHHEMSAPRRRWPTRARVRPGLRARRDGRLDGEKMSKSKGNLVLVSALRESESTRW